MTVAAFVADISKYNSIGAYGALKNHFDGIIVRIGYRGYSAGIIKEDALFRRHMGEIIRLGLPYGFYFMSQAVSESEAIAEAEYCYGMTKQYAPEYPYYYDSELGNPKGDGRADKLSRRRRTDIALAFCRRMEELGRKAGVYASKSWFGTKLYAKELEAYSIWVAQYNSTCSYQETAYDMWQYTSSYQVPGLSCRFDRSRCMKGFGSGCVSGAGTDMVGLADGIHTYSLKEDGDKTFTIDGNRTNFRVREFRGSDGADGVSIDGRLVRTLQEIRNYFGRPLSVTCVNAGGNAADINVMGIPDREVALYAEEAGVTGIGLYDYTGGFVRIDVSGTRNYWRQDAPDGNCYGVKGFGSVELYIVNGRTVATVRYNDRNKYVKILQEALGIKNDGIFGAQTEEAVRIFQKTHGLAVDGIVGVKTWGTLL